MSATAQYNLMQARANVLIEFYKLNQRIADVNANRPLGYYTSTDRSGDTSVITGYTQGPNAEYGKIFGRDCWNPAFGGFGPEYNGQTVNVKVTPSLNGLSSYNTVISDYGTQFIDLENNVYDSNHSYGFWIGCCVQFSNQHHLTYKNNGFYKVKITFLNGSYLIRYIEIRLPTP